MANLVVGSATPCADVVAQGNGPMLVGDSSQGGGGGGGAAGWTIAYTGSFQPGLMPSWPTPRVH